ncbi:MAG: SH3 domain-containing protein [Chloroflexi bacterium]|nr:SH3 domain-containing protein [Chloroflexota bacterium]
MEIVCKTCKKPFNAHPGETASAAIDFTFGRKHTFICDNCKAENILTKAEYEAIKDAKDKPEAAPKPVVTVPKPVAKPVAPKPVAEVKPVAQKPVGAPKPVAAPKPVIVHSEPVEAKPVAAPQPKEGKVIVDSLRIRKDHNTSAEIVAGLAYGNKVTILGTWTDGKNTWAQIGPDQWAAIEHNGKKMIEVV